MIKPTIHNKLLGGFAGVLALMSVVAGIGCYAVLTLRQSAQDAVRIGARLNSIALEIQVHDLEAQRRVAAYLAGPPEDGDQLLDEAQFEVQEIEQLASRAVRTAPDAPTRAKFQKIADGAQTYQEALDAVVNRNSAGARPEFIAANYQTAATRLRESAEDGEVAGREAAQLAQEQIQSTSRRSVLLVSVFSALGLILGVVVSLTLARAILTPVEHLRDVADNVSLGNLEIAVRRYSEDEIGDLADSFSRMVAAVKFFKMEADEAHSADQGGAQSQ